VYTKPKMLFARQKHTGTHNGMAKTDLLEDFQILL
jgi:hypothetical protein